MKVKIGLKLNIQMDVKTKLFSTSKNNINSKYNENVSSDDIGIPGSMPTLNKKSVELAVRLALLLNSKISEKLYFDRKNYFYHNLPKGFKITQYFKPLAIGGSFEFLKENNEKKKINIDSIILEEDVADSKIFDDNLYVCYNKSGVSLIKIVTKSDFDYPLEIKYFLNDLIEKLKKTKIIKSDFSDKNIKISINLDFFTNDLKLKNNIEIKNLNKIEDILKVISLEYEDQKEYLKRGIFNLSIIKKYDQKSKKIIILTKKIAEEDYYFIPETNILPIEIPKEIIDNNKKYIKKNINF